MAIVRLDKVHAGATGNIESVVVYNGSEALADFANGLFVTLGELEGIGREVHKAEVTTAENGVTDEVLLVSAPEITYDERISLYDFKNEAGDVVRAYYLTEGDVFTFTKDILPSDVAVGQTLVAGADGKLVAGTTGSPKIAFEVIEDCGNELTLRDGSFALKVVKNITIA